MVEKCPVLQGQTYPGVWGLWGKGGESDMAGKLWEDPGVGLPKRLIYRKEVRLWQQKARKRKY